MIISKTPLRISFVGGGTDYKDFYKHQQGMVISATINKYVYVIVNKRFEGNIRLNYTKTEIVDHVDQLQHELIKEAMKLTGADSGVDITTIADIPGWGTGLGSSSSVTVGALNALYAFRGKHKSAEELAKEACKIEIDILGGPNGKQDQYIVAYGGLNALTFKSNEEVSVEEILISDDKKNEFNSNLLLFYTGKTRKAHAILSEQKINTKNNMGSLVKMKNLAKEMKKCLTKHQLNKIGELLHKNWLEKKQLATEITNSEIDFLYQKAIKNGALGGKICGAGGGGFLLFYCEPQKQKQVKKVLSDLRELKFQFEPRGSEIIFTHKDD